MRLISTSVTALLICVIATTTSTGSLKSSAAEPDANLAQDAIYLDRRISMLETRLSSIESTIRTLQQQAVASERTIPAQPARDPEVALLRSEVEILQSRLREIECGLVHLDERTLSAAAKQSRQKTPGQAQDPCRLNPETPLQLSLRR